MIKKPPTLFQTIILAGFVLSCFGLLLFLWLSFGGATPLRSKSYRVYVPFDEATQLADQADVRVSGVPIGNVVTTEPDLEDGLAIAEISIDPEFAPIPANTRATLRAKTLLGETYVEFTPGDSEGPTLPEGGNLPRAQVADSVQLDEILRTFDPETRQSFSTWMIDSSQAVAGRGESLSSSIGQLEEFFSGFDQVFRVLDSQEQAVQRLFANGATTFRALSRRQGELRGLIRSSNQLVQTTASRDQDIIDLFQAWPTFLEESRLTVARLRTFSEQADPLFVQLTPAAKELSPTLIQIGKLAPDLDRFLQGLRPVIARADRAFPALQRLFADKFPPLLEALDERFLPDFNPFLEVITAYRHELTALLGNVAAGTNATYADPGGRNAKVKYFRAVPTLGPDTFATYPGRTANNRSNAYTDPEAYSRLGSGLLSYETRGCGGGGIDALLDPATPLNPAFNDRVEGDVAEAEDFFNRIQRFGFADATGTGTTPAPACTKQPKVEPFGIDGTPTDYPQAYSQP